MIGMCTRCRRRPDCRKLCQEAETYVSRGSVGESSLASPINPALFDYVLYTDPVDPVTHIRWSGLYLPELENAELGEEEWLIVETCGLTQKQKAALYLRYWAGFDAARVGETLGISRQVAAAHVAKAVRQVAAKLRPPAPDRQAALVFLNRMTRLADNREEKK